MQHINSKDKEKEREQPASPQQTREDLVRWLNLSTSTEAIKDALSKQAVSDLDGLLKYADNLHWSKQFYILQAIKEKEKSQYKMRPHFIVIHNRYLVEIASRVRQEWERPDLVHAIRDETFGTAETILESILMEEESKIKEMEIEWCKKEREKAWQEFYERPQDFDRLCEKLKKLGDEEKEIKEKGETLPRLKVEFDRLVSRLRNVRSNDDQNEKDELKKECQQLKTQFDQLDVVKWNYFLSQIGRVKLIMDENIEKFHKMIDGELFQGSDPILALKEIFFYYECLGRPQLFYDMLHRQNENMELSSDTFNEEYIAAWLKCYPKKVLLSSLEEGITEESQCWRHRNRYNQLGGDIEAFKRDVLDYYQTQFEEINAHNWENIFKSYHLMQKAFFTPRIATIQHRGLELLDLQHEIFSRLSTHYGNKHAIFYGYDELLELRDAVFDLCNPATMHLHKEDIEERTKAMLNIFGRFVNHVSEKYNDHTFTAFLDDIYNTPLLQSYLHLPLFSLIDRINIDEKGENIDRTNKLLKSISKWRAEKEKVKIDEEENRPAIPEGKGKEKEKEKEEIVPNEEQKNEKVSKQNRVIDPIAALRKKIHLALLGRELYGRTEQGIIPEKGQNYLYWVSDRTSSFLRLQHRKHSSTGIKRAQTLLEEINTDVTITMMQEKIQAAYDASPNRKHSLSRYLKAALNDLPLEIVCALADDDFKKIRDPLIHNVHNELTKEQVSFLESQPENSTKRSSSLSFFGFGSSKKQQPNEAEVRARNKILLHEQTDKERYIAALKYIATYPGNEISKQLLSAMQPSKSSRLI